MAGETEAIAKMAEYVSKSLSGFLCVRHSMAAGPRSFYAEQEDNQGG